MKSKVILVTACLLQRAAAAQSQAFTEGFDDITTLPGSGWFTQNNSQPVGTIGWFQGNPLVFPAHTGATNSYIGANFNNGAGVATISNWLLTPPAMLVDGATLTFFTRTIDAPTFADRLQVRMSTAGAGVDTGTAATDVGTFTALLLDINPTYVPTSYPQVWTQFTVTVTGVPTPTLGRLAFRYFVENAGPSGANSDYIGIDTVVFTPGVALATVAPASLAVDTAGNGVLQPNEAAVVVAPSWENTSAVAIASLGGTLSAFTGPAGPTYTINDSAASYGALAAGATSSCGSNCYAVTATAASRPATHWDASALETVTVGSTTKTWTLHVGDSFTDVAAASPFYRFVEILLHHGVTTGCTTTTYCPTASTTREQMAVFVLVAKEPPGYNPPACVAGSEDFSDVPASSPFCRWIEELATRGVVSGCGGGNYCPTAAVTREQMAIFTLLTLDPTLNPPPCVAGSEQFADVPASSPFCRWIEELFDRGVVSGCGGGNYCPTAAVTREQMGVFLSVTFDLTLYGL
jgi:hypothetical protein